MKFHISGVLAIVAFALAGVIGSAQSLAQTPTTLYSFCSQPNCADGVSPASPLAQAANGDFYGTTTGGGADGSGTVFQITAGGTLTTLYNFCSQPNCTDGAIFGGGPGHPRLCKPPTGISTGQRRAEVAALPRGTPDSAARSSRLPQVVI